jgi:hypothetical protein
VATRRPVSRFNRSRPAHLAEDVAPVAILALSRLSNKQREIGRELGLAARSVTQTLHIVYDSLGIQPRAGRRDLGRALVAHGIISMLDLPAGKPSRSPAGLLPRPRAGTYRLIVVYYRARPLPGNCGHRVKAGASGRGRELVDSRGAARCHRKTPVRRPAEGWGLLGQPTGAWHGMFSTAPQI